MKRRLFHLFQVILPLMLIGVFSSCGEDDEVPGKLGLINGTESTMVYAAGATEGYVQFHAGAAWSCWTALYPSGAPESFDWIELSSRYGQAGDMTVSYSLERNLTGNERVCYLVIICEDERVVVKIVQSADDDGQEPQPTASGRIVIRQSRFVLGVGGLSAAGDILYDLEYNAGWLVKMVSSYRDDLDYGSDDYCETVETTTLNYQFASGHVKAIITEESTYYPSGRKEVEISEHEVEFAGRSEDWHVISGWYRWDEDPVATEFDFSYNSEGYLTRSRNDDSHGLMQNTDFVWGTDGNLTSIVDEHGNRDELVYSDKSLKNNTNVFDLNWVFPTGLEVLDFAAGDLTRIWAVAGMLGKPSENLATSITETISGGSTRSCRMTYVTHTAETTVAKVEYFVNNQLFEYSNWEISYYGVLER